jgi:thiopeptide-type bacteriocin biosynthesis protein
LTLRGLDLLLDDLGLPLDRKLAVVAGCRDRLACELGVDQHAQRVLGEKFRRERVRLDALLGGELVEERPFVAAQAAFRRRSERVARLAAHLHSAHDCGELGVTIEELASSYLHMHANRMLRSAARPQELVLYDFLQRLYEGQRARGRGAIQAMTGR